VSLPTFARPVAVLYYSDARGGLPISQGACKISGRFNGKTIRNLNWKKAVTFQLFALERYRRAEIVDRATGELMCTVRVGSDGQLIPDYDVAGTEAKNYQWREKMKQKAQRKKGRA